ncbi:hypothetical protein HanRHA438_Chr04g0160541 [Helianthus annuus]|nr:hypothetical protein HanHA300_Chr04g0123971 [Helianthus annuus]KAJ0595887.1 hypothetical protein HanHA89_Chr04g0136471 [Helianthus annuus]KAJ0756546.1 hypothetical protein HanLR1_Chr04g0128331 [Helianthus annuus]KAJ0925511.1 hypothetical protein HanRHA438_Chr04g0160541 [Helianthus annuus]
MLDICTYARELFGSSSCNFFEANSANVVSPCFLHAPSIALHITESGSIGISFMSF